VFRRLRDALARKLYKRAEKEFAKKTAVRREKSDKDTATVDPDREFLDWIVSDEGRREDDMEFLLTLTEMILIKISTGELVREDVQRLLFSSNPFRELRMRNMIDRELQVLLEEQASRRATDVREEEFGEQPPEPVAAEETAGSAAAEKRSKDLLHKALGFAAEVFPAPRPVPVAEETPARKTSRIQIAMENERMEQLRKAALVNAPEFLESLGKPDHYESDKQQARQEKEIVRKEKQKLRPRLTKDEIPFARPREKTPKELAQEKLKIIRKMKQDLGGRTGASV
jgi:hypothetical protein